MKQGSKKKMTLPVAKSVTSEDLKRKKRNVAGIDIGASSIFVCAGTLLKPVFLWCYMPAEKRGSHKHRQYHWWSF